MVEDSESRRLVTIPAEREWWPLFFLPVWFVGWAVGEIVVGGLFLGVLTGLGPPAAAVPNIGALFLMAGWLIFWTAAGCYVAYWWLWLLSGIEIVEVDARSLAISRQFLGWVRRREYLIEYVTGLRIERLSERRRFRPIYGIAFDHGSRIVRFAPRKNPTELERIITAIAECHPLIVGSLAGAL
jgi:hypothetical protein